MRRADGAGRVEEPVQSEGEARVRSRESRDGFVVEIPRARAAGHTLEGADEVTPACTGAKLSGNRQFGVHALDVEEGFRLQVEDGRIFPRVRDLQDALPDQERLIPFAPEVADLPAQVEEIGGDRRDFLRGEPRRRRLEDVQGLCDGHALILRRDNAAHGATRLGGRFVGRLRRGAGGLPRSLHD
jgi:hypothetical protein